MSRHRRQTLLGRLAPGLPLAVLLASACTEPTSPDRRASGAVQMATTAGDTVRITGSGTLGPGPQAPGNSYQEVNVDVASTLSGSFLFRDWSVVRPDGSVGQITVSPTDAATSITAFRDSSTVCADPTHGVEFEGVGRVNTQGNSDPSGDEFLSFTAAACDDGPAGSNLDLFALSVPGHGYNFGPDRLTSGDLAKTSGGTTPPPTTGDLTVATSTTGSNLDPDGYTLTIDGGSSRAIGINASTTFTGLASGSHTVALSGVAGNCTVHGGPSRTVDVPAGGTASVSYAVTCRGGGHG